MTAGGDAGDKAPGRDKLGLNLPADLIEAARDAAWWCRISLAELGESALRREIARLAKREGHDGGAFPRRKANLRPGRRSG